jgi:hypothetical protein
MLAKLEAPDPESRTPDADGRRIERLDDHRTWGWHIINYSRFREIASEEQRREKTRDRVARFKANRQQNATGNAPVTHGNAPVTLANAGNAMQRQKEMEKKRHTEPESTAADTAVELPRAKTKPDASNGAIEEEIWKAYPKKVGKPAGLRHIRIALKTIDGQELLKRTVAFAAATADSDQRYTPNPSTWFNQERYNDDPTTWNSYGRGGNTGAGTRGNPVCATGKPLTQAEQDAETLRQAIQ